MCGRYINTHSDRVYARMLGISIRELREQEERAARYNVPPGTRCLIARADPEQPGTTELTQVMWGLVPPWVSDKRSGYKMINARLETADSKPSFRTAFRSTRCLVCTDGWYEWCREGNVKAPYLIRKPGSEPFFFAGLWTRNDKVDEAGAYDSFSILTRDALPKIAHIHPRMPVALGDEQAWHAWLDQTTSDVGQLHEILEDGLARELESYPVSSRVNSPKNDDEELLEPVG